MRIAISCMPSPGGSGVLASELGRALARRGHEIHFVTSSIPHRLRSEPEPGIIFHEVRALHYPVFEHTPFTLALAAKLAEVWRHHKLDLFHVHYAIPHAAAAFLAREMLSPCHSPIITTLHGTDVTLVGQDSSYRDMVRFCLNRSDAVTAVSDWLKDVTEREFHPETEVRRIHNFADHELFRPRPRDPRFLPGDTGRKVFLHVSNFRPVKRVQDVVRTFARAVGQGVDGVLALAGEGPDLGLALEVAEREGVRDRVRLLGVTDDVSRIIPNADVFLFPSDGESFGLAPLEAMLCEVPVVGALAGGLPEVVEHGATGFLHHVGDVEGMAASCVRLSNDPDMAKAFGQAGRERSIRLFSIDSIVDQYEALYREHARRRGCCCD
ncbi:MAG TPA: N-acetyl-alpha-D-glucosaminyl L-malate synthase BshA [Fibrobacteria bacterium]|nr:N-acetyl-alpha-D-glucosaminyl L-malate synthase BshA [Fibrobacteria bacterium]